MKMKKALSLLFALCIAGSIFVSVAALAENNPPLYIPGDASIDPFPSVIVGDTVIPSNEVTVYQFSSTPSPSGTLQGGPLNGASTNSVSEYVTNYTNALPRIEKDPTSEEDREAGTSTSFIARAANAAAAQWFAISPVTYQSIPIEQLEQRQSSRNHPARQYAQREDQRLAVPGALHQRRRPGSVDEQSRRLRQGSRSNAHSHAHSYAHPEADAHSHACSHAHSRHAFFRRYRRQQ